MDIAKDIVLPCLCSFVACCAFGVQFNIRPGHLIAASVGSLVSQLIFSLMETSGYSSIKCCFVAAAAVAVYSEAMARFCKAPVNMYLIVGIIPLVPGGLIYYTMIALMTDDKETFLDRAVDAFSTAGAIAMGIFAVSSAVRIGFDLIKAGRKKYRQGMKNLTSKSGEVKKF